MNDAIPTPYDIASISQSPFSPSLLAWTALASVALIAVILLWARTRRETVRVNPLDHARRSLSQSLAALDDSTLEQSMWRASSALKRFISATDAVSTDTLSLSELEDLASRLGTKHGSALLPIIAALDAQRFSPIRSLEEARTLIQRADDILRTEQEP